MHYMSFEEDAVVSVGDSVVNISGFYFSTYSATRLASQPLPRGRAGWRVYSATRREELENDDEALWIQINYKIHKGKLLQYNGN